MATTYDVIRDHWRQQISDPGHRRMVAGIMAATITRAHEKSPGCWMVSHFESPLKFNINVGRAFVFSVHMNRLSVILDTAILPEGAIGPDWGGGGPEHRFRVIPEATWVTGPVDEVLERWKQLEVAYFSAVDKATRTSKGSPWWRRHEQVAVQLIGQEAGVDLPVPALPSIPEGPAEDLQDLLEEFCAAYPVSPEGMRHVQQNLRSEGEFRHSFQDLKERRAQGRDVTDEVLLKLLPHSDSQTNRARGAWITSAPVLHTDIKKVFEGGGRARAEHWPIVANLLMDFFESCELSPGNLEAACRTLAERIPAKGFQSAIVSPGLTSLNPDCFCIVNKKPLIALTVFSKIKHTSKLIEYPATNADLLDLVELSREVLESCVALDGLGAAARFDMFTHWYVAVRPPQRKPSYWKISPGEQAFNWDACRNGGFISMGWEKFGDISEMSRDEFDSKAKDLEGQDKEYSAGGTPQLWLFANDVQRGDWVLANLGTSRVLGYGKVTGDYYFEPGVTHAHRLPVAWQTFTPRDANMTGWQKTILPMSQARFEELVGSGEPDSPPVSPQAGNVWMFQANPKLFDLEHALQMDGLDAIDAWKVAIFKNLLQPRDTVLLWQSGKKAGIYAVAELTGPVFEVTPDTADEFVEPGGHKVPLRITQILDPPVTKARLLEIDALANLHILKAPFGTNFKVSAEEWEAIKPLLAAPLVIDQKRLTLEQAATETGFPETELQRWLNAIDRKGQGVLYGPPGTGKTYVAERLAKLLIGQSRGFHELVQFHPAYAYEDFIQGLRPVLTPKGGLDYRLVPGRFLEFCRKAERYDGTCVLILDEINRANLARVFGELMYLLEYRDQTVPLASGGELRIPKNVRLIGTMNTADRSIALVDHALRRRFAFIHLRPQYSVLERFHHEKGYDAAALVKVLRRLNQAIDDPHYEVGISFFLRPDLGTHLEDIWRMEIEPYLEEYFFDQAAKAKQFLWDDLKKELA